MQRTFTREFKLSLCKRLSSGEISKTKASQQYRLGNGTIERWMEQFGEKGEESFQGKWRGHELSAEERVAILEEELRQTRLELAFARKLLDEKKSS